MKTYSQLDFTSSRYEPRGAFGPFLQGLTFGIIAAASLLLTVWVARVPVGKHYILLAAIVFLMCVPGFRRFDLLQRWELGRTGSMGTKVFSAWFLLAVVLIITGFVTRQISQYDHWPVVIWLVVTPAAFVLAHVVVRQSVKRFFPDLVRSRSAVIVFTNSSAESLVNVLGKLDTPRFELQGYFEDRGPERTGGACANLQALGTVAELPEYVKAHGVEVVFLVLPAHGTDRVFAAVEPLEDTTASIYYVPDFHMFDLARMSFSDIGGIPALTMTETPFYGADGWFKRAMDILFAGCVLLALAPLFLVVAILIRLNMGSPVFFTQRRYGLDGREIQVHKFRTMEVAEDGPQCRQVQRNDPRVTRLGHVLRRLSIDEWPQFWNVLTGEMSVVGPRPHAVTHNEQYRKLIKRYMVRHKVKPGLTGWAQVHGLRGETRDLTDMEQRIRYDLDYIERWSPELDLRIALRTLWIVFQDHEAY